MEKKLKILLGSCGGLTGLYLAKTLTRNFFIKCSIYGIDVNEMIPTRKFLDKLYKVPKSDNEKDFLNSVISIINEEEIDVYIPTHSKEFYVVSKHEDYLRNNTNVKFVVSPFETFKNLENKKNAYLKLKEQGLDVPKIYDSISDIEKFPVFTKPAVGSGSKNAFVVNNFDEARLIQIKYPENFFMEYVGGKEYTVDCIFDLKGDLISYNQRVRMKTLGGAVIVTKNDFSVDFKNEIDVISKIYKIKGPCNFQFFYQDGRKILTDINLRFASGGLPLTMESGVNVLEIMIKMLLGIPFDKEQYKSDRKNRVMYRYFEEFFEVE